ncbi:HEAT repeat domain-containing protein [Chengkuizengella axinellae]|uniref:DNA alkylation repair protein n=1 Tax=Chengkuizengella axinellae TaxID=3064388 RepID=A0ABT9IU85_9BACL|nr:DNA alkylation repair protein [Chengkuizengella sp. 2205SS18-9]MDP5272848.1 DNA alkylation repair protein [Chengkuizengella sp. 2205SS18-9]
MELEKLEQSILSNNVESLLNNLKSQATNHAETPKQAVKNKTLKMIKRLLVTKKSIYDFGIQLTNSNDIIGEEMGSILIAEHFELNPEEVNDTLLRLADSDHWEVREWVASACSIILVHHFQEYYPRFYLWTKDESPNVRRAVAVAVKYVSRSKNQEIADSLIDLVEPLLSDQDSYVKKNLGAFAIGDGLLKYYPHQVMDRIRNWISIDDENVRWNIAKIFSSAEGMKYIEDSIEQFNILMNDSRPTVKKAVNSTVNKLKKRDPELYNKCLVAGLTEINQS